LLYGIGFPLLQTSKPTYHISTIHYPWYEVEKVFVNLFIMEGRYTELFGVHFVLLNHFRGSCRINFSYFLFHSLYAFTRKNRNAILIHQGMIKVLVDFVNIGARRISSFYQQMHIIPSLYPTPMGNLGLESHRNPFLPKEPTKPLAIELCSNS